MLIFLTYQPPMGGGGGGGGGGKGISSPQHAFIIIESSSILSGVQENNTVLRKTVRKIILTSFIFVMFLMDIPMAVRVYNWIKTGACIPV